MAVSLRATSTLQSPETSTLHTLLSCSNHYYALHANLFQACIEQNRLYANSQAGLLVNAALQLLKAGPQHDDLYACIWHF